MAMRPLDVFIRIFPHALDRLDELRLPILAKFTHGNVPKGRPGISGRAGLNDPNSNVVKIPIELFREPKGVKNHLQIFDRRNEFFPELEIEDVQSAEMLDDCRVKRSKHFGVDPIEEHFRFDDAFGARRFRKFAEDEIGGVASVPAH